MDSNINLKEILRLHSEWVASSHKEGHEANLRGADLSGANLCGANLCRATLCEADLRGASLREANLYGAKIKDVKSDFYRILYLSKTEVPALFDALQKGKIDGFCYEGECCCLVGTLAKARASKRDPLPMNSSSPAEKWFMAIRPGDTPQSSALARITAEWTEEFARDNNIPLPSYKLVSSFEHPEFF